MNQFTSETTVLEMAKSGDAETKFIVAQTYLFGDEIQEDYWTAVKLLYNVLATDPDYTEVYVYLGMCCLWGIGTEENPQKAFAFFSEGAKRNNAKCRLFLGTMYNTGCGVRRDQRLAVQYFEEAAQGGDKAAARQLAQMYKEGDGVEKDEKKAKEYEQRGIDFEYYGAVQLCRKGGGEIEELLGVQVSGFMKNASDFGVIEAQFAEVCRYMMEGKGSACLSAMGGMYLRTDQHIVDCDAKKGLIFELRAAELNNCWGHRRLGHIFYFGHLSIPVDKARGIWHWQKGVELGETDCIYNIGILHEDGEYLERDFEKSFSLFKRAAEKGHLAAMDRLACCYICGRGVEQNREKGLQLLLKAGELGKEREAKERELAEYYDE